MFMEIDTAKGEVKLDPDEAAIVFEALRSIKDHARARNAMFDQRAEDLLQKVEDALQTWNQLQALNRKVNTGRGIPHRMSA